MNSRLFYSFSTELLKMAADVDETRYDADTRDLLADRRGDDKYLPGGKLRTNAISDMGQEYEAKVANDDSAINLSSGVYDLPAKKKRGKKFQHARDYAVAGSKGAFVGLGATEAARKLVGHFDKPTTAAGIGKLKNIFRAAAGIGAGASILERAYRYRHLPGESNKSAPTVKKAMVTPLATGPKSFTPARAFQSSRRTGMFEAKVHTPPVTKFRG